MHFRRLMLCLAVLVPYAATAAGGGLATQRTQLHAGRGPALAGSWRGSTVTVVNRGRAGHLFVTGSGTGRSEVVIRDLASHRTVYSGSLARLHDVRLGTIGAGAARRFSVQEASGRATLRFTAAA
jgi:hypothetical protein